MKKTSHLTTSPHIHPYPHLSIHATCQNQSKYYYVLISNNSIFSMPPIYNAKTPDAHVVPKKECKHMCRFPPEAPHLFV